MGDTLIRSNSCRFFLKLKIHCRFCCPPLWISAWINDANKLKVSTYSYPIKGVEKRAACLSSPSLFPVDATYERKIRRKEKQKVVPIYTRKIKTGRKFCAASFKHKEAIILHFSDLCFGRKLIVWEWTLYLHFGPFRHSKHSPSYFFHPGAIHIDRKSRKEIKVTKTQRIMLSFTGLPQFVEKHIFWGNYF